MCRPTRAHPPLRGRFARGFTLVELMVVVAIIGVLAALASYGVRAHLQAAKSAEAKQNVGAISRGAIAAFERESASAETLAAGKVSKSNSHNVCGTAKPVPAKVPKGTKYQPNSNPNQDFNTGDSTKGWSCLRFSVNEPIYYRYTYAKGNGGRVAKKNPNRPGKNGFEAAASGDLDGDGVKSFFAMVGKYDKKTDTLRIQTQVYVEKETE